MAAVPEKGKEIAEDTSDEQGFSFQNLVGQELSKAEKEELQEYVISCGYQPGAMLFGGINEEALGCIRDRRSFALLRCDVGLGAHLCPRVCIALACACLSLNQATSL